jgi:transposase, IS30 family
MIEVLPVVRPGVPVGVRREFWKSIAEGRSTAAAAAAIGVSVKTGRRWFGEAGGMSPVDLAEPSGRYLGPEDREHIALRLAQGRTQAQIARELGRARSTVSREVCRNSAVGRQRERGPAYRPRFAQYKAEQRAKRPKVSKLASDSLLHEQVQVRLSKRLSPRQISRQLKRDFPDDGQMRVSYESIYRSLYVQGRGELRRELTKCLRTGRAVRRPRARTETRGTIPNMIMISERPAEVADRAVPGHWEGDLIIGAHSRSAVGTLVERSTRFVMLLHLPTDHTAETVKDALVAKMLTMPTQLRRSLTWDQGVEMAKHGEVSFAATLPIYFCDPASPWQRGSNENTNGLLRQYFPKGTDLSIYPEAYLDFVAAELNDRPRETLNWDSPAERIRVLLSPPKPTRVATTG